MVKLASIAAAFLMAAPGAAPAEGPPGYPSTAGSVVAGLGHFRYADPGPAGHRIWFGVHAATTREGVAQGRFWYRHELPDGSLLDQGWADVTCLRVIGDTALFTAIVPEGQGGVRNHGYYVKVVDGGRGPDRITDAQAQNGAEPPPRHCIEPGDLGRPSYPVLVGGYAMRGRG